METYPVPVQQFVEAIKQDHWQISPHPISLAEDIARANPEYAPALVRAFIAELPSKGDYLFRALMFLPNETLPELVEHALGTLQVDPRNKSAEELIGFVSRWHPAVLHQHLQTILGLVEQVRPYPAEHAWYGSGPEEAHFLQTLYENPTESPKLREFALLALLEMRFEPVLQSLLDTHEGIDLSEAGYVGDQGLLRKLYADTTYHLRFPEEYPFPPVAWAKREQPAWHLPDEDTPSLRFGGALEGACSCCSCGETVQHLLTLDPVPEGLGVSGGEPLSLAVCHQCLGNRDDMGIIFYQHDPTGLPVKHLSYEGQLIPHDAPSENFRQVEVRLTPTPENLLWQVWDPMDNMFRVGGHPCWVQGAEYPDCPTCSRAMPFLLQIGSGLALEGDRYEPYCTGWLWGSGGLAYIHWCDRCRVSAVYWQCT